MSKITRYNPELSFGLTDSQVNSRKCQGLINIDTLIKTKSIKRIILDNTLTLFNILNFVLALSIIYVGSYKNLLFMGVVLANLVIGTYQEIRAKITVDRLSIVASNKIPTIRNGNIENLPINELVLDDLIELKNGNQVPADCIIIEGEADVNESLLTGEFDSIHKKKGDTLLSGSFIVSGKCKCKIEHVGEQNYAFKISNEAKYVKKVNSQIMNAFNKIILIMSILIIPIGLFLFLKQYQNVGFEQAIINTTAALIGMIPEGLVLLTSTVLAVSVIRLSKRKVLVQELYCIETLARVDILCLDKTGTITEGTMKVDNIIAYKDQNKNDIDYALSLLVNSIEDSNPTFNAIRDYIGSIDQKNSSSKVASNVIPFSSEKKWSGAFFEGLGSYIIGAPEFVLRNNVSLIKDEIQNLTKENRVILIAHSKSNFNDKSLPDDIVPMGFVLINDVIRSEAKDTLKYFEDQGVKIKIISGDNVSTVSTISKKAGLKDYDNYIDATTLSSYDKIKEAASKYSIFGRVSPMQKKQLIKALKENGHTVAMTGDGVNDVLALKESDCSVVMANGSDAARNVAQLVLLNSDFSSMPKVVLEGRRSINNIQRSSSLFLVKTIYATLLSIIFLFINISYPFVPIQMTLTSVFTIGIPSFILALEPNKDRVKGNLFVNIISKALPCAIIIVLEILATILLSQIFSLPSKDTSTICVILTGICGLGLLFNICSPFNLMRKILFGTMASCFFIGIVFFTDLFSLSKLNLLIIVTTLCLGTISILSLNFLIKLFNKISKKNKRQKV